jgi:hypothetical protein
MADIHKLADIILIDGNPTLNIYEMLETKSRPERGQGRRR